MLAPLITNNLNEIKALCQQHKVKELYAFGSAVRTDFNKKSDVDFLYRFDEKKVKDYFINFFEFKESIEKLLKRDVDLVFYDTFKNKIFSKSVEESKVKVYEA
jgi:predicted nucleotidyltransferase